MAHGAGRRLVNMLVFRNIFGSEPLDAVSGFRAAVNEEWHVAALTHGTMCPEVRARLSSLGHLIRHRANSAYFHTSSASRFNPAKLGF